MSWLFSRALVAEYSADTCSDGEQSVLSSENPTPQAFLSPDRMTAFSRLSRFGMTFAPLTANRGAELLMSFLGGFPARTSALQERAQESPESGQDSGLKWRASLAKFDPATSSWKTVQLCLLGDSELSSVTWPRSGMTADGQCWELPTLALRTKETGCGLWPTPVATDYKGSRTPESLAAAGRGDRNNLRDFMRAKDGWLYPPVKVAEYMMGWPLGWTDLKPLETAKFLSAPQPHGECLRVVNE